MIGDEKSPPERIKNGMYEARVASFGFQRKSIYVANYFDPAPFFNLDIDAIYISGGNTFGTMKLLRDSGLDKVIVDYVQNGVVYVGGSAGAHIATANISHVAKYDKDIFGLIDFRGLGLYHGILICHYTEDRKEDYQELKALGQYNVRALTDAESMVIRDYH